MHQLSPSVKRGRQPIAACICRSTPTMRPLRGSLAAGAGAPGLSGAHAWGDNQHATGRPNSNSFTLYRCPGMTEYYRTLEKREIDSLAEKCGRFLGGWRLHDCCG